MMDWSDRAKKAKQHPYLIAIGQAMLYLSVDER